MDDDTETLPLEHSCDNGARCDECGKVLLTAASLAVHQQRKHGQRVAAALRRVILDGAFRACGRFCHTKSRLLKHLQTAETGCWLYHLRLYHPVFEEQTLASDEADRHNGTASHQRGLVDHAHDKICMVMVY